MWSSIITLDHGFLKFLNYVPKEREKYTAKNEPLFSRSAINPLSTRPHQNVVFLENVENVAIANRNYFRRNNQRILKLATYTKIEDHYFRCKLATF